jgi:membrane associated rhomboid family serine protease
MHPDPYQLQPYPVYVAPPPTSGLAVASGIAGIISALGGCFLVLPPFAAVILGHMATRETRTGERGGHGWAITGLITGYLFVVPMILAVGWLLLGLMFAPVAAVDQ